MTGSATTDTKSKITVSRKAPLDIALMGVHTNICILDRAFGVGEMTRLGFHAAAVRDLTDAMYDARKRPFVGHARGSELVMELIEANWRRSILSQDMTRIVPATDGPL